MAVICDRCGMETVLAGVCGYCGTAQKVVPYVVAGEVKAEPVLPKKTVSVAHIKQPRGRRWVGAIIFWFLGLFWLGVIDDLIKSFWAFHGDVPGAGEQLPIWLVAIGFFMLILSSRRFWRNVAANFILAFSAFLLLLKPFVAPLMVEVAFSNGSYATLPLPLGNADHLTFIVCGALSFILWGIFLLRNYFNLRG